jgi:hypothetical protein
MFICRLSTANHWFCGPIKMVVPVNLIKFVLMLLDSKPRIDLVLEN